MEGENGENGEKFMRNISREEARATEEGESRKERV
jgi:hypothetical protein